MCLTGHKPRSHAGYARAPPLQYPISRCQILPRRPHVREMTRHDIAIPIAENSRLARSLEDLQAIRLPHRSPAKTTILDFGSRTHTHITSWNGSRSPLATNDPFRQSHVAIRRNITFVSPWTHGSFSPLNDGSGSEDHVQTQYRTHHPQNFTSKSYCYSSCTHIVPRILLCTMPSLHLCISLFSLAFY